MEKLESIASVARFDLQIEVITHTLFYWKSKLNWIFYNIFQKLIELENETPIISTTFFIYGWLFLCKTFIEKRKLFA